MWHWPRGHVHGCELSARSHSEGRLVRGMSWQRCEQSVHSPSWRLQGDRSHAAGRQALILCLRLTRTAAAVASSDLTQCTAWNHLQNNKQHLSLRLAAASDIHRQVSTNMAGIRRDWLTNQNTDWCFVVIGLSTRQSHSPLLRLKIEPVPKLVRHLSWRKAENIY